MVDWSTELTATSTVYEPITIDRLYAAYYEAYDLHGRPKTLKCGTIFYKRLRMWGEDYLKELYRATDNEIFLEVGMNTGNLCSLYGTDVEVDRSMPPSNSGDRGEEVTRTAIRIF